MTEYLPKKNEVKDLAADTAVFASYLQQFGLPTDNIIASTEERAVVAANLPGLVSTLSLEERKDARYLSKFIGATAIGLFDAALNYIWNEVVLNLRKKTVIYGIDLFYDAAVGGNNRRFAQQPVGQARPAGVPVAAALGQIFSGSHPQPGCQHLQHNSHKAGKGDNPQQAVLKLRPALQGCAPVAGIHIAHAYKHCRAEEGLPLLPKTASGRGHGHTVVHFAKGYRLMRLCPTACCFTLAWWGRCGVLCVVFRHSASPGMVALHEWPEKSHNCWRFAV